MKNKFDIISITLLNDYWKEIIQFLCHPKCICMIGYVERISIIMRDDITKITSYPLFNLIYTTKGQYYLAISNSTVYLYIKNRFMAWLPHYRFRLKSKRKVVNWKIIYKLNQLETYTFYFIEANIAVITTLNK